MVDLVAVRDVAWVEADLVDPGLNGLKCALEVEVHIRNDRYLHLLDDLAQGVRILALWDGNAHHIGAGEPVALDFRDACIDVVRVASRHGLHQDRGVAANE